MESKQPVPDRDFAQYAVETLMAIDRGNFVRELGAGLYRALEAHRAHTAKASVNVVLTFDQVKEVPEAVTLTGRVTEKLPSRAPRPQFLFVTPDGGLSVRDPRQAELWEPRTVEVTAPSTPDQQLHDAAGGQS